MNAIERHRNLIAGVRWKLISVRENSITVDAISRGAFVLNSRNYDESHMGSTDFYYESMAQGLIEPEYDDYSEEDGYYEKESDTEE